MRFNYMTGEYGTSRITRVYRSECGRIGKVKRTAKRGPHEFGKVWVKYFDWSKPDSAPEYDTLDECLEALEKEATKGEAK